MLQFDNFFKFLWKVKAPPSVLLCVWKVVMQNFPTRPNLRRKWILAQDNLGLCTFCGRESKTEAHLLLSCYVSDRIWKYWYDKVGVFK